MVAVDGSPQSFAGLRAALELGQRFQRRVEAVAVYDPYLHYAVFNGIVDVLSEKASKVFRFKEQEALHEEIIDTGLAKIYEFAPAGGRGDRQGGGDGAAHHPPRRQGLRPAAPPLPRAEAVAAGDGADRHPLRCRHGPGQRHRAADPFRALQPAGGQRHLPASPGPAGRRLGGLDPRGRGADGAGAGGRARPGPHRRAPLGHRARPQRGGERRRRRGPRRADALPEEDAGHRRGADLPRGRGAGDGRGAGRRRDPGHLPGVRLRGSGGASRRSARSAVPARRSSRPST